MCLEARAGLPTKPLIVYRLSLRLVYHQRYNREVGSFTIAPNWIHTCVRIRGLVFYAALETEGQSRCQQRRPHTYNQIDHGVDNSQPDRASARPGSLEQRVDQRQMP